jgi:hypothetical protein
MLFQRDRAAEPCHSDQTAQQATQHRDSSLIAEPNPAIFFSIGRQTTAANYPKLVGETKGQKYRLPPYHGKKSWWHEDEPKPTQVGFNLCFSFKIEKVTRIITKALKTTE